VPVVSGSAALRNDDTLCTISLPSIGRAVVVRSSRQTTGDERVGLTPKVLVFRRYQPLIAQLASSVAQASRREDPEETTADRKRGMLASLSVSSYPLFSLGIDDRRG
jgi:hypothetical protein